MPLLHQSSNVVVAGRFNPYIFSPDWLKNQGILDGELRLMLGGVQNGIGFSCGDKEWQIDDRNMIIAAGLESGELANKILDLLSHTPVSAIGINFSFEASSWERDEVPKLGDLTLQDLETENAKLVTWAGVFHVGDTRVSMEVAYGTDGLTVSFNHHTPVENANAAGAEAMKLQERLEYSRRLIDTVLTRGATQ